MTVHENNTLSEIDKFIYLKRFLSGQALAVVSGLSLNAVNYKEALKLLEQLQSNPQVLISAYMKSLLKLEKVKSMSDISGLRKLANDIENCVRDLRSMKVETSTYGSLLIPILKERLPDELVIHISRRFGFDIWTLDLVLKYMNEEIQASENCVSLLKVKERNEAQFSTYNFSLQGDEKNSRKCVYCWNEGHSSSQCRKVTNIRSRTDILKRRKRCFLCLGLGHQKRDCASGYVCKACNGKHHISVCFRKTPEVVETHHCKCEKKSAVHEVEEIQTSTVRNVSKSILLQTASAEVSDFAYEESATTCYSVWPEKLYY